LGRTLLSLEVGLSVRISYPRPPNGGAGQRFHRLTDIRWDVGVFAISVSRQGFSKENPR